MSGPTPRREGFGLACRLERGLAENLVHHQPAQQIAQQIAGILVDRIVNSGKAAVHRDAGGHLAQMGGVGGEGGRKDGCGGESLCRVAAGERAVRGAADHRGDIGLKFARTGHGEVVLHFGGNPEGHVKDRVQKNRQPRMRIARHRHSQREEGQDIGLLQDNLFQPLFAVPFLAEETGDLALPEGLIRDVQRQGKRGITPGQVRRALGRTATPASVRASDTPCIRSRTIRCGRRRAFRRRKACNGLVFVASRAAAGPGGASAWAMSRFALPATWRWKCLLQKPKTCRPARNGWSD